ncbi:MAG: hypothetical protein WCO06_05900 [Candidatus Roizmanbacteria bacterium]
MNTLFDMPADLKQNIFYTIYFIILHNFLAIIFAIGIVVSLGMAFYKPSRKTLFIFIGFILFLFAFEYNKHIAEPLTEQTVNSLITEVPRYKLQSFISKFLIRIVPALLYIGGAVSIGLAGFIHTRRDLHKNRIIP